MWLDIVIGDIKKKFDQMKADCFVFLQIKSLSKHDTPKAAAKSSAVKRENATVWVPKRLER